MACITKELEKPSEFSPQDMTLRLSKNIFRVGSKKYSVHHDHIF